MLAKPRTENRQDQPAVAVRARDQADARDHALPLGTSERGAVRIMHKLWRGIDAKLDYAQFHLEKTSEALVPPRLDAHMVPIAASGAIVGHEWPWHHHHRQDHDRHRRGPMVGRPRDVSRLEMDGSVGGVVRFLSAARF
jgi:hypothetical protein